MIGVDREYQMVGTMPLAINRFGRVEPGCRNFVHDMDDDQEAFFLRINALRIVRDVPPGKKLKDVDVALPIVTGPDLWPIRPEDAGPPLE